MEAHGQPLFKLIQFEMIGTSRNDAIKTLLNNGYWKGDIVYNQAGKKLIFSTCCNLIKDAAGLITSIVITTRNISEQIEQEKELAIAENKYQTLVESLSEGVMLINANGTIGGLSRNKVIIF